MLVIMKVLETGGSELCFGEFAKTQAYLTTSAWRCSWWRKCRPGENLARNMSSVSISMKSPLRKWIHRALKWETHDHVHERCIIANEKAWFSHVPTWFLQVEVFVHDQREKFAKLYLFEPENIVLRSNSVTTLLIRPEFIEKQNKKQDPCTLDEGHSYSRVSWGQIKRMKEIEMK